jgi:hypothetical protein
VSKRQSTQPHCSPINKVTSHRRALEQGTHTTHSCSLADVCLSVGALARAVACWGGLCCHGVSGQHLMTNMWEAPEEQRDSILYL